MDDHEVAGSGAIPDLDSGNGRQAAAARDETPQTKRMKRRRIGVPWGVGTVAMAAVIVAAAVLVAVRGSSDAALSHRSESAPRGERWIQATASEH